MSESYRANCGNCGTEVAFSRDDEVPAILVGWCDTCDDQLLCTEEEFARKRGNLREEK